MDVDGDGVQDAGELGISGVTVTLVSPDGSTMTTTTDGNGYYLFPNLPAGEYTVIVGSGPDGTVLNTPSQDVVNLTPGQNYPDADFGFTPELGSIGDFVWLDVDGDGVQDAGELGISGVTVTLVSPDGSTMTTTTDGNGYYLFPNLPAGEYTVIVGSGPDGTVLSTPSQDVVNLTPGQNYPDADFGFTPELGSIGDFVWLDVDGDGVQDAGELGISGVTVTLVSPDGSTMTTTTDGNGYYLFPNLPAGEYTVIVGSGPDGTVLSTPSQDVVNLTPGQNYPDADFGFTPELGSIGDFVWLDVDGDGVQDAGELGISGVTVTLVSPDGSTMTTTTDGNGYYLFPNLPAGEYTVIVGSGPDGTVLSTPSQDVVNLTPGQNYPDADFGFTPELGSIGDFVWLDVDGDGVQDAGELGISGVTVTLVSPDGSTMTTTTDGNGYYLFPNLPAGEYTVIVGSGPDGTVLSTPSQDVVNLTPGQNYPDADFGFTPELGSIGDFVWLDVDGDGVQDAGELGISGVTVTLVSPDGSTMTTTTDGNGYYLFPNLPAGNYTVIVGSGPNGTALSTPGQDAVVLAPGQNYPDADFGFVPNIPGTIGDFVWYDLDGDGIQDPGEPGIAGVVVTLTLPDGSVITTTTDITGHYTFTDLPIGTYTVTVGDAPEGSNLTAPPTGSYTVVIESGTIDLDNDFGFQPGPDRGLIGDFVWIDTNGNGVDEPGEIGIPGVVLNLHDAAGNIIASTITDDTGYYLFANLPQGLYTVAVDMTTVPEGFVNTTPITHTHLLNLGEAYLDADFGFNFEGPSITEYCIGGFPESIDLCVSVGPGEFINLDESHSVFDCNLTTLGAPNNCVTYTPFPAFEGTDTVTLAICQIADPSDCEYVTFVIHVGCTTPTALPDFVNINPNSVIINGVLSGDANGFDGVNIPVTNNDSDPCDPELDVTTVTQAGNGTVIINPDNTVGYVPDADFEGTDTFTYTVCNDCGNCDETTVTVTVDRPCELVDYNLCTGFLEPITVCPDFCLDGDVEITDAQTTYSCSLILTDECVTYTPLPLFYGNDVIQLTACNQFGQCETIEINIFVGDCDGNEAPVAVNDQATVSTNGTVTIDALANDYDPDGDPITVNSITDPAHGTVVFVDGQFIYTPNAGYEGYDSFQYQICDDEGECDIATVTINVVDNSCEEHIYLCAAPMQQISICPDFCDIPNGEDVVIQSVHTTYNCSIQMYGDECFYYTALPLFVGEETITIIGQSLVTGVIDTAYVTVNVTNDCDAAGEIGVAPTGDNLGGVEAGKAATEEVSSTKLQVMSASPVPTVNVVSVYFEAPEMDELQVEVFDLAGHRVIARTFAAQKGINELSLELGEFAAGTYIVTLQSGTDVVTQKVVKQ